MTRLMRGAISKWLSISAVVTVNDEQVNRDQMYIDKIAVILLKDLADWQKLNVTAFLASSVAIAFPETHGAALVSASGTAYLPFLKHPILVYAAESDEQLERAFHRAVERWLHVGIYTKELFATKNEEENLQEVAQHPDN